MRFARVPRHLRSGLVALALAAGFVLNVVLIASALGTGRDPYPDPGLAVAESPFALPGPASPASPAAASAVADTNCRYGVGYVPGANLSDSWIPTLGAGWYGTFTVAGLQEPSAQFVPIIRLRQDFADGVRLPSYSFSPPLSRIAPIIRDNPGSLWLVGNEVEIDNTKQDNIMPELYARAYHEAYTFVKSVDPTATVGIGSVTMGTPGRLQYLDIVWDTYQQLYGVEMPIDVWNVHIYILAERTLHNNNYADGKIALGTDPELAIKSSASDPLKCPLPGLPDIPENDPRPDVYCKAEYDSARIFSEQVRNIRQWMKEHGEQDKPLIISEFGQLSSYTNPQPDCRCEHPQDEFGRCMCPERVIAYLERTTRFLESATDPELGYPEDGYRLVQRWLWYSLMTPFNIGRSSNLLGPNYATFLPGSEEALTPVGKAFRRLAHSPANTTNLVAGKGTPVRIFVDHPADTTAATISARFHNAGTRSAGHPFAVSFFADEDLTQLIGYTLVDTNVTGPVMGCRWVDPDYVVQIEWPDLPVGIHDYWAVIDSSLSIRESSETDNVTTRGKVEVYSHDEFPFELYLPLTDR